MQLDAPLRRFLLIVALPAVTELVKNLSVWASAALDTQLFGETMFFDDKHPLEIPCPSLGA